MLLKAAKIKDSDFINEVNRFTQDHLRFHLWWLGQSGYLLLWDGKKILIDPYLSDSLTKKYAQTSRPHVRLSERVVDPNLLEGVSIISSSHNHTDHLDGETLEALLRHNPRTSLIIPEANRDFVVDRLGVARSFPIGLSDGTEIILDGFSFFGVPAKHNEIERDQAGNCKFMGYIIGFEDWLIYHSGDTLHFEGMEEILRPFQVDVAILPINGDDASRGVAGNLNGREAAWLAKSIGARLVIPCHYDMFAFNTANPGEFERTAQEIGQPYRILEPGGHFASDELPAR